MKWIINKYVFFIVFGIIVSLLTSFVIKETTLKKLRIKHHENSTMKHAMVVYSFAEGKQQVLLEISATILGDTIASTQQYPDLDIEQLKFLCPSLNDKVKKIILKNYDEHSQRYLENNNTLSMSIQKDKQDFSIAYNKLISSCKK